MLKLHVGLRRTWIWQGVNLAVGALAVVFFLGWIPSLLFATAMLVYAIGLATQLAMDEIEYRLRETRGDKTP